MGTRKKASSPKKKPVKSRKKKSTKKSFSWSDERIKKITGFVIIFAAIFLGIALVSYLFTWKQDQDKVLQFSWRIFWQADLSMSNWGGRLGAILSHGLIYWGVGISSFLIIPFLLRWAGNKLNNHQENLVNYFIYLAGLSIYLAVFLEAFFVHTSFAWGGAIGESISYWISNFLGEVGLYALLLLIVMIFMIWSINPNFNYRSYFKDISWFNRSPLAMAGAGAGAGAADPSDTSPKTLRPSYYNAKNNELEPEPDTDENFNKFGQLEFVIPEKDKKKPKKALEDVRSADLEINVPEQAAKPEAEFTTVKPVDIKLPENPHDLEIKKEREGHLAVEEEEPKATNHIDVSQPFDPINDLPGYKGPSVELLLDYDDQKVEIDRAELEANKDQIISTLLNYKIEITKIRATIGPTVTLYEIVPAPGVRISKIKNLEDDIALSLSALGIRIIAPIPGKGTIGIEVPNKKKQIVSLKEVLLSDKFQNSTMELPIGLGKTIANEVFVADLAKMPHMLIAGATGQGKSVGINTILMSLLYKKHPSEVKLVLIDPKKVELFPYATLKQHFLGFLPNQDEPITTETSRVVHILNSLCIEMDQRYDLLKKARARNLKEYNKKFRARKLNPENGHRFLPYIVLVIDEFADLIMTAGKEVELPIGRLAQLARAIGIHLIIATQRPSVNIITGIIKANFPARIAFKVTSKIDSRTILDGGGAEQLIGRGDMLLSVGGEMIRLQCAFVDTPEVENVLDHIGDQKGFHEPFFLPEYVSDDEKMAGNSGLSVADLDASFEDAARLVVQNQLGSTSMIQRRMKLGYNRAGRIMDQLEAMGIVGETNGSKPREVLVFSEAELDYLLQEFTKKG